MSERNVLILGLSGSGKSWLLNQILGRNEFDESTSPSVKPLAVSTRSKSIKDNINSVEYKLILHDTPSLNQPASRRVELFDTVIESVRGKKFHQIVIIHNFGQHLDEDVKKYYEILSACLLKHIKQADSSITLVINRISRVAKDEEIISCCEQLVKSLDLVSNEMICIKQGETPRDCVFKYLIRSKEDGNQFQDRNFLAIISQSSPFVGLSLKTIRELEVIYSGQKESNLSMATNVFRTWGSYASIFGMLVFYISVLRKENMREFLLFGALWTLKELAALSNFQEIQNLRDQINSTTRPEVLKFQQISKLLKSFE